jgi:SAM-dependent methyltransferase
MECYLKCGGNEDFSFKKNDYNILKCSRCGLYRLETSDEYDDFLKKYYSEGYFKSGDDKFGYADYLAEESMVKKNMRSYLNDLKEIKNSGELLDVGCASGFLLEEAKCLGYEVSGIDTSEYIVSRARDDIRESITCSALHEAKFESDKFDVITMFDLIEHLSDPLTDLKKVSEWLNPEGILVIGTGDVESLYSKLLGHHNHFFAPPHHLFFFSRKTITKLLEQSGLKVVSIRAKGKWLTIPYVARVAKHFDFRWMEIILNSKLFLSIFGKLWIYLFFGDNMVVWAKKRS